MQGRPNPCTNKEFGAAELKLDTRYHSSWAKRYKDFLDAIGHNGEECENDTVSCYCWSSMTELDADNIVWQTLAFGEQYSLCVEVLEAEELTEALDDEEKRCTHNPTEKSTS